MTGRQTDEKFMARAIEIAANGMGRVSPNPMVGAVIVRDGEIIGEGWHEYCGGLHAERNALKNCRERGNDPAGATMYVILEPCCHYGKTPPCTEAIMENGLGRVVFGAWDPNPLVAGKGIEILRNAGIQTEGPVLESECIARNEIFFHYITTGMPYVIMKYAMTADGKIAAHTGDSKWITAQAARRHTHETRKLVTAIMVGIGTVLADDPMLNCRLDDVKERAENVSENDTGIVDSAKRSGMTADAGDAENFGMAAGSDSVNGIFGEEAVKSAGAGAVNSAAGAVNFNPVRIICDSRLRIPMDSQIVKTAKEIRTIIASVKTDNAEWTGKASALRDAGAEVLEVQADSSGRPDMGELMRTLGKMKIDSILLEGGSEMHFSALQAGVVSKVQVYIAPKLIGGAGAKSPVGGVGIDKMADCVMLSEPEISMIGNDVLLEYKIKN